MVLKEMDLLAHSPFNVWKLIRIQTYDKPSPNEVAKVLEIELQERLRFYSFSAEAKAMDNRIYIRKVRLANAPYSD